MIQTIKNWLFPNHEAPTFPEKLVIGDAVYEPVVLLVHSKVNGKVKLATVLRDDEAIDLQGDEEFVPAWVKLV